MTTVYGIKTCDTCRKAVKSLGAELRDVRVDPLSEAEIARFVGAFGAALVNTRSTSWRGLEEAERGLDPSALIAVHPTVMKRPVIERDGQLYLGVGQGCSGGLGRRLTPPFQQLIEGNGPCAKPREREKEQHPESPLVEDQRV